MKYTIFLVLLIGCSSVKETTTIIPRDTLITPRPVAATLHTQDSSLINYLYGLVDTFRDGLNLIDGVNDSLSNENETLAQKNERIKSELTKALKKEIVDKPFYHVYKADTVTIHNDSVFVLALITNTGGTIKMRIVSPPFPVTILDKVSHIIETPSFFEKAWTTIKKFFGLIIAFILGMFTMLVIEKFTDVSSIVKKIL